MKTFVKLNDVRAQFANINGTPCAVVKRMYAVINDMSAEEEAESSKLIAVLPAERQECINRIPEICAFGGVGVTKTRSNGTQYTPKFTTDLVLRFFTKYTNALLNEYSKAKAEAKKAADKEAREAKKAEERAAIEQRKAERAAKAEEKRKAKEEEKARKEAEKAEKEKQRADRNAVNAARIEEEKKQVKREKVEKTRNAKKSA